MPNRTAHAEAVQIARANAGLGPLKQRRMKAPTALQLSRAKEILKRAQQNGMGGEDSDEEPDTVPDAADSPEDPNDNGFAVKGIPKIEWPSALLFVGKKFAGKTNFIKAMLEPEIDHFDNVFLFTITKHRNNLNHLASHDKMILTTVSDEFFDMLLEHQIETDAKTLLIFDDIIGMPGLGKQMTMIRKLAASGRNFNISIIFSTQDVTEIATTFRRNAEHIFLGNNSIQENKLLAGQLAPPHLGEQNTLRQLVSVAKRKRNEFFHIDVEERDFDIVRAPKVM